MLHRLAQLLKTAQMSLFDNDLPDAVPTAPAVETPAVLPRGGHMMRLNGHPVAYELRRARRRSIGFTVTDQGLRVSAPKWIAHVDIERALQQKSDWIVRKLREQQERVQRMRAARVVWADGCEVPYLGSPLRVRLDASLIQPLSGRRRAAQVTVLQDVDANEQPCLRLGLPPDAAAEQICAAVQGWLQRQALRLFEIRCLHYAVQMDVQMSSLRLSSAQGRWGSASASGAIRLNWRLIHMPMSVIDYVVVHELAHLREMNHSARFWAIVEDALPDFERARQHLKQVALPEFEERAA
ncbi:MAG: M48 family metallopeptidase [Burkholderiaceae bacterium]|nr:M48 family metallopeptidase [Burkholderiaceae bacterium]